MLKQIFFRGRKDLNPQPTILKTAVPPIELRPLKTNGDSRTRTGNPLLAKQMRYQLRYAPLCERWGIWTPGLFVVSETLYHWVNRPLLTYFRWNPFWHNKLYLDNKVTLSASGVEPLTSGFSASRSTNWATQTKIFLFLNTKKKSTISRFYKFINKY